MLAIWSHDVLVRTYEPLSEVYGIGLVYLQRTNLAYFLLFEEVVGMTERHHVTLLERKVERAVVGCHHLCGTSLQRNLDSGDGIAAQVGHNALRRHVVLCLQRGEAKHQHAQEYGKPMPFSFNRCWYYHRFYIFTIVTIHNFTTYLSTRNPFPVNCTGRCKQRECDCLGRAHPFRGRDSHPYLVR